VIPAAGAPVAIKRREQGLDAGAQGGDRSALISAGGSSMPARDACIIEG
jgi:hypothetical protein